MIFFYTHMFRFFITLTKARIKPIQGFFYLMQSISVIVQDTNQNKIIINNKLHIIIDAFSDFCFTILLLYI